MPARCEILIAWGDCDAAGIVYFPRFFYWMDVAFQALLREAGFSHHTIYEQFGARLPSLEVTAQFVAPATYDDRLTIDVTIVHWGTKSIRMSYKGARDGKTIFEGSEARVWATIAPDGAITSAAIPLAFKDALAPIGRQA
jgi:YbgC/YbaW family acyl-CoA thioester hydrolase